MAVNVSIGMVGVALQKDERTPAAEPTFAHGLTGGTPINVSRSTAAFNFTCGNRASSDSYVESIETNPSYNMPAFADVLPLYYYAGMGTIASSMVSKGIHKHTITVGDKLHSITVWGQEDMGFARTDACKVNELGLSFEGTQPLDISVATMGCDMTFLDENPMADTAPSCFGGYYVCTDGTFKIDTASDTPAEATITGGSVTINNNCNPERGAGRITPSTIADGRNAIAVSLDTIPDDFDLYQRMVTGSSTGTKPLGKIVYGSFYLEFTHSENPNWKLIVWGNKVPFSADIPEIDPEGTSGKFTFAADEAALDKQGGSPLYVEFTNDVVAYLDENGQPLAEVEHDPEPPKVEAVASGIHFGKDVSEFGTFEIDGTTIKGEAKKVEGFKKFSSNAEEQSGYYCELDIEPWEGVTVTSSRTSKPVKLKDDGFLTLYLGKDVPTDTKTLTVNHDENDTVYQLKVTAAKA